MSSELEHIPFQSLALTESQWNRDLLDHSVAHGRRTHLLSASTGITTPLTISEPLALTDLSECIGPHRIRQLKRTGTQSFDSATSWKDTYQERRISWFADEMPVRFKVGINSFKGLEVGLGYRLDSEHAIEKLSTILLMDDATIDNTMNGTHRLNWTEVRALFEADIVETEHAIDLACQDWETPLTEHQRLPVLTMAYRFNEALHPLLNSLKTAQGEASIIHAFISCAEQGRNVPVEIHKRRRLAQWYYGPLRETNADR
ncbi:MAG: hypothetical protein HQL54_04520 [Magnetococcales bacterium]|nr:hypothetical protein [Magnetococcales bacterium]